MGTEGTCNTKYTDLVWEQGAVQARDPADEEIYDKHFSIICGDSSALSRFRLLTSILIFVGLSISPRNPFPNMLKYR